MCGTFERDPHCLVAVLSLKTAGCGLNLTVASRVIFAELYWNPGVRSPCIGTHENKQKKRHLSLDLNPGPACAGAAAG